MPTPGDVLLFASSHVAKRKYHLCVNVGGGYLYINSPKGKPFVGDFIVDGSEFPFLDPTPSGKSVISCNVVMRIPDTALRRLNPVPKGRCGRALLARLCDFIETTDALSAEDKEWVLSSLGNWV